MTASELTEQSPAFTSQRDNICITDGGHEFSSEGTTSQGARTGKRMVMYQRSAKLFRVEADFRVQPMEPCSPLSSTPACTLHPYQFPNPPADPHHRKRSQSKIHHHYRTRQQKMCQNSHLQDLCQHNSPKLCNTAIRFSKYPSTQSKNTSKNHTNPQPTPAPPPDHQTQDPPVKHNAEPIPEPDPPKSQNHRALPRPPSLAPKQHPTHPRPPTNHLTIKHRKKEVCMDEYCT